MKRSPQSRFIGLALHDSDVCLEAASAAGMKPDWLDGWERTAWELISEMNRKGKAIDPSFVADYAKEKCIPFDQAAMDDAHKNAPIRKTSSDTLVDQLRKDYVRRMLGTIKERMNPEMGDPVELAAITANEILSIIEASDREQSKEELLKEIEQEWRDAVVGKITGLPMPWRTVYTRSGSIDPGHVCLVVGHGNAGKSYLMLQWAMHVAETKGPVLYFPLEDTPRVAWKRMGGMDAGVNIFHMRMGSADHAKVERAIVGLRAVADLPLHVSWGSGHISDIALIAQQYKARHGVCSVFIDAAKDIRRRANGVEGDIEVMSGVCEMAKRLKVPVVMSHHVRKAPSNMKSENIWRAWDISPDDLRGSGHYWDAARMVIALQSYPRDEKLEDFTYQLHLLKSNHGITGIRTDMERDRASCKWMESISCMPE